MSTAVKVCEIVDQFSVRTSCLYDVLEDDLGLDGYDCEDILDDLQDAFDVQIPLDLCVDSWTVHDLIEYVNSIAEAKAA